MSGYNRISKEQYYLDIAFAVSKRSNCLKRHYGAVIVKDDEIIATGYNGSPRGKENCCDTGVCLRLNVPSNSGNYAQCHSVHAEQNAILSTSRDKMLGATLYLAGEEYVPSSLAEGYIYKYKRIADCSPCPICDRLIANSGIVKVVGDSSKYIESSSN
jgi:dCMP deaminase